MKTGICLIYFVHDCRVKHMLKNVGGNVARSGNMCLTILKLDYYSNKLIRFPQNLSESRQIFSKYVFLWKLVSETLTELIANVKTEPLPHCFALLLFFCFFCCFFLILRNVSDELF